jgi:hypothetical protein
MEKKEKELKKHAETNEKTPLPLSDVMYFLSVIIWRVLHAAVLLSEGTHR